MTIASGRDLALIYFILIAFIAGLVPLLVFGLAVKGIRVGRRRMMPYVHVAQFYAARLSRLTKHAAHRVTEPFVSAAGFARRVNRFFSRFTDRLST